jgi:hypothetical protein
MRKIRNEESKAQVVEDLTVAAVLLFAPFLVAIVGIEHYHGFRPWALSPAPVCNQVLLVLAVNVYSLASPFSDRKTALRGPLRGLVALAWLTSILYGVIAFIIMAVAHLNTN